MDLSSHECLPPTLDKSPTILFRAVHAGNQDFALKARDVARRPSWAAFDDCLSWRPVGTPFIPFTNSWDKALHKRDRMLRQRKSDVVILAIWAKGMFNVYDADHVASLLGYREGSADKRRRLEHHTGEYLVWGGISDDEYRLLAVFDGSSKRFVDVSVPGLAGQICIPDAILDPNSAKTANECLEDEIYRLTGLRGPSEELFYLIGSCLGAFHWPWRLFRVVTMHSG